MLRQLLFGRTDMHLHHHYDSGSSESVFDVQRAISETTSVLPQLPENRSLCSFQHIFSGGYAAGYYSYKWAEVLSADAFAAFEEAGLENPVAIAAVGRRFRDTVLALGGSRHPMEVYKSFRGREPDPQALLRQSGLA
jgi:oligopeptidase A